MSAIQGSPSRGSPSRGSPSRDAFGLPDYLCPNLALLSIGLNPSLPSVRSGVYFGNPRNRFWRALIEAEIVPLNCAATALTPSVLAALLSDRTLGFTDVVKRPTRGVRDLQSADYRRWVPVLCAKLVTYRPNIIWFHGRVAAQQFVRFASFHDESRPVDWPPSVEWGWQAWRYAGRDVFVSPNPSSANAAFSLQDLVHAYRPLEARLRSNPRGRFGNHSNEHRDATKNPERR
ncbi:MAG: mismatch-specific DNA-glycosylase [Pseudomonadota bacterium]